MVTYLGLAAVARMDSNGRELMYITDHLLYDTCAAGTLVCSEMIATD